MGKYIAVTGFFGAGSSAVLDLLSEYECNGTGIKNEKGGYEHTVLYHPGGIFDLEDKLLHSNDMHRSDEALRTFELEMMRLNDNNFGWFGSFKEMFGGKFAKSLNEFMQSLGSFHIEAHYYGQCKKVIFNPLKVPVQLAAKILTGRTIYVWGRQFIHNPYLAGMNVSFPTEEEFYIAAKKFVKDYMNLFKVEGKTNVLFDRLLQSHHVGRVPYYFDEDFRLIVVRRDVRDIYFLNKYLWPEINAGSMYPTDIDIFIDYWKRLNRVNADNIDKRVLYINFEDLIYKYVDTVKIIENHCELVDETHTRANKYFDPSKSIKNTQVYKLRNEWEEELKKIERELPEFCYSFPYENVTDVKDMFDNSRTETTQGILQKIIHMIK